MNFETPTPSIANLSKRVEPTEPDWQIKEIYPSGGSLNLSFDNAKLLNLPPATVPKQFGPRIKIFSEYFFTIFSKAMLPDSANPDETIIAPFIFFFAHSSKAFGTTSALTAIIASSIGSSIPRTEGKLAMPNISLAFGFTG